MVDASKAAKDFVKESKDGPVNLDNLTKSSKAAQLAMKGLAIAGNMLAVYLASKIITSLYELSQVSKEVAASAKFQAICPTFSHHGLPSLLKSLKNSNRKCQKPECLRKILQKKWAMISAARSRRILKHVRMAFGL